MLNIDQCCYRDIKNLPQSELDNISLIESTFGYVGRVMDEMLTHELFGNAKLEWCDVLKLDDIYIYLIAQDRINALNKNRQKGIDESLIPNDTPIFTIKTHYCTKMVNDFNLKII